MTWDRQSLERGDLVWLLDLHLRGKVYRFSTEPVEVSNTDPKVGPIVYQYRSGLEFLDYQDTVALMDTEASTREVAVSVLFGTAARDGWAAIANPKKEVGGTRAELSLWIKGSIYEDRQLIVSGFILEPTHGGAFEPVKFTITESDFDDPALYPPIEAKVDRRTWPRRRGSSLPDTYCPGPFGASADSDDGHIFKYVDNAEDQPYPFIFGNPGSHPPPDWHNQPVGRSDTFPAVPVSIVRMDHTEEWNYPNKCTLLIAGHEVSNTDRPGAYAALSPQVYIYNETRAEADGLSSWWGGWAPTGTWEVKSQLDGRGRLVSVIEIGNFIDSGSDSGDATKWDRLAFSTKPGDKLWAAFSVNCAGIPNESRTGPLSGAGEVISYLLDQSKLRIDTLQNRVVLDELNGYRFDFWINEPRSPWETIAEDILPLVPVSPRVTPKGLGFVLWKWDAVATDAVDHVNIDRSLGERTTDVEVSPFSNVYNVIRIDYCYEGPSGKPLKSLTYTYKESEYQAITADSTGDHNNTPAGGLIHNPYSFASFTQYGPREGLVIEAPIVEQDATARAILDWKIRFHAQTHRTVSYRLPQSAQAYEVGDVVTVTDSDIGWADTVCLITGLVRAPGQTIVTFTTVSNWARDLLIQ